MRTSVFPHYLPYFGLCVHCVVNVQAVNTVPEATAVFPAGSATALQINPTDTRHHNRHLDIPVGNPDEVSLTLHALSGIPVWQYSNDSQYRKSRYCEQHTDYIFGNPDTIIQQ